MRRIVTWAMSTLTVIVLLFSYSTSRSSVPLATAETRQVSTSSSSGSSASSGTSAGSSSDSSGGSGAGTTSDTTSDATSGTTSDTATAQTVAGDEVMTRFGVVQVQISVSDGKISAVDVLQVPNEDRHDQMINSQAVPIYNDEAVSAQSAQIDVVSGATVTWEGYTSSLQSAIDQANL